MKFIDYVTITARSGAGGAGAVAFRREKFVPKGGPAGGDGGDGGSVIIEGDDQLYTLLDLRYNRHHYARRGEPGSGANKKGKDGEDIVLRVPCGTIARRRDTGELIGEVLKPGDRVFLARGGKGGKGNAFFKSATNRAPRFAQPGTEGEELEITLELRLLADVGLVGFPNAGKSTLISSLSAAKPKIAEYPFTTVEPNLGVVYLGEYRSFVMADIPGIIEGAHEGRGLGHYFLKHIERNSVLLLVIPVTSESLPDEYRILVSELEAFNSDLLAKPRLVALSKMDLVSPDEAQAQLSQMAATDAVEVIPISSVTGSGLAELKEALWKRIVKARQETRADQIDF